MRVESQSMSVGELTSFIYLFTLLIFPLRIIGYVLSSVPHSASGYKRVREILDESVARDPQTMVLASSAELGVRLEGVSFRYDEHLPEVVSDVSLDVAAGTTVVIVGATGSGKSTLLSVMAGLLQPSKGQVSIANRSASIVFQEPFLFSGTIRHNIDMGRSLADHILERSLYLSAADEFVAALDDGVNTVIGERGISLSGGQRQRISLARAIAQDCSVLLLDDTTSALDTVTESLVIDRLRQSGNIVTTIIVASRPSTIALADEVIFIENGALSDQGSHPDLLLRNENYRLLMRSFEHDREQGIL